MTVPASAPRPGDPDHPAARPVHPSVRVERRPVTEAESRRANGPDWDRYADEYQSTHGEFLGDIGFVWGPEGHTEADLGVLGDVAGLDVLEVGSGAGQCSRWVGAQGGRPVGLDLSMRQLQHSRRIDEDTGVTVPSVLGTATQLPFADASFDVVFCSFGALQFVADIADAVAEAARVLRPGGRFAFSITHPTRWMFPDDPGEAGLLASQSYWDRRRTSRSTTRPARRRTSSTTARSATGWPCWPGTASSSTPCSSPSGRRATTASGAAGPASAAATPRARRSSAPGSSELALPRDGVRA